MRTSPGGKEGDWADATYPDFTQSPAAPDLGVIDVVLAYNDEKEMTILIAVLNRRRPEQQERKEGSQGIYVVTQ